jgi:glycosyltransferase domain-containing protein
MSMSRSRYTLLIPTFNRPAYLRSLLGYLAARRFEYPVRVLDTSSDDALAQNRETVARAGLDLVHEVYDPTTAIYKKLELAIAPVESTYCSFCGDDDILFTDRVPGLLDVLDANPTFDVAHGYYVNFKPGEDFDIWSTVYSAPSIASDDALKRIVQQMKDYQAIFYGVHRTQTMKSILAPLDRVKSLWAKEMLTSSLTLIAGSAYRVPHYYMARNTNPSIATEGWHPYQFFAVEPAELFREYAEYRAVTLEHLRADARCRSAYEPQQLERVFDLVHLKYLMPMLKPQVIDFLIDQSLRSDVASRQMVDDTWKVSAATTGGRGARLPALLDPNFAIKVLKYMRRLARHYGALRSQSSFDVRLDRSLSKMTVRTAIRNGQNRRYVLSRDLMIQDLADGGYLTTSHLRDIIQHFDDYV